jgi:hypothetical protein
MTEKSGFESQEGQEISLLSIAYRLALRFTEPDVIPRGKAVGA